MLFTVFIWYSNGSNTKINKGNSKNTLLKALKFQLYQFEHSNFEVPMQKMRIRNKNTMKNQNRTPPIIVHNAPKEKQALLNEFEQRQRVRLSVSLRHALMTLNYKDLGNTLAFMSKRVAVPQKTTDKTEKENTK